jgi:CRP-like cAMP-binding protein
LNHQKDETIFHQGDPADAVFYLKSGDCKVSMVSQQGKEAVIALLSKGDFFGESCLTGQQTDRVATVTAITQCEFMRFDKMDMMCLLHKEPEFSWFFISYLLARNARVEADLVDQLFNTSEKRLARQLLLMANFGKERNAQPILARVNQATLAKMVGTTRSRVSYFLNKFRKLGLIECKPLRVHSSLFMFLHDDPAIRDLVDHSQQMSSNPLRAPPRSTGGQFADPENRVITEDTRKLRPAIYQRHGFDHGSDRIRTRHSSSRCIAEGSESQCVDKVDPNR